MHLIGIHERDDAYLAGWKALAEKAAAKKS